MPESKDEKEAKRIMREIKADITYVEETVHKKDFKKEFEKGQK